MRKKYGKAFGLLLGVLLFFTLVSRVTASVTTPQIITEQPGRQPITHVATMEGQVEGMREVAVWTEPGLLVDEVYVKPGQRVKEGEVLAVLNLDQLDEQIQVRQEEITILKITQNELNAEKTLEQESINREKIRAAEDYEYAVQMAQAQVDRAAEVLGNAQIAYESAQWDGGQHTEEEMAFLLEAVQAAKSAYESALQQQEQSVRMAARAVEDAQVERTSTGQAKINEIRIAQLTRDLAPLLALGEAQGQIVAPVSGVVVNLALATGQWTAETAAVTLADETAGFRCVAMADASNKIREGDAVTLLDGSLRQEGFSVTAVEPQEDGSRRVTVLLGDFGKGSLTAGMQVSFEIRQASTASNVTIPVGALHEQNGKYYVYVAETVGTVLGEEYRAVRVDVRVVDRNDVYAALEEGTLSTGSLVIVDSDRYVEAGSRVRLWEE